MICHFHLYKIEFNQRQKCIASIKLEVFFEGCLGKYHFIEVILAALLKSVVCKMEPGYPPFYRGKNPLKTNLGL